MNLFNTRHIKEPRIFHQLNTNAYSRRPQ